jgi:hypothetical protein
VNRRLRLALFLAALVATGPMPSVRVVETSRADVSIAWFRGDRTAFAETREFSTATPAAGVAHPGFRAHRDPGRPQAFQPHSLFQRPPPLQH